MKFLAFSLFAICVLPNNNKVEGGFDKVKFINKGYKGTAIPISLPTPQCVTTCPTPPPVQCPPCPAPPVPPPVQCPTVQCPEVHCPQVHCPPVQCPEVHCPTVICPSPKPDIVSIESIENIDSVESGEEICHCNPETPLSPVSSQLW